MNVYVVVWSYYEDWSVCGVFKTEDGAKDFINEAIKIDRYSVLNQYKIIPTELGE